MLMMLSLVSSLPKISRQSDWLGVERLGQLNEKSWTSARVSNLKTEISTGNNIQALQAAGSRYCSHLHFVELQRFGQRKSWGTDSFVKFFIVLSLVDDRQSILIKLRHAQAHIPPEEDLTCSNQVLFANIEQHIFRRDCNKQNIHNFCKFGRSCAAWFDSSGRFTSQGLLVLSVISIRTLFPIDESLHCDLQTANLSQSSRCGHSFCMCCSAYAV